LKEDAERIRRHLSLHAQIAIAHRADFLQELFNLRL
jgi:hypothetical protein